jgi:hypothetical protein
MAVSNAWRIFCVTIPLWILLVHSSVLARVDAVPGSRYTSGRAAALGDAFLPLGDDAAAALFYNPAVFGKLRGVKFELFNFQFQMNSQYLNMARLNFYQFPSLSNYAATLSGKEGAFPAGSASVFPNFSVGGFGFGVLMHSQIAAKASGTTLRYRSKYQLIPAIGTGVRLASGVVKMGYSLQWINQALGDLTVENTVDPLGYNQGLAKGSALSHNFGFAVTLPVTYLPSVNIVARNILNAKFTGTAIMPLTKNDSGVPPDEPMSIDVSYSMQSKVGKGGYFNYVYELRDVTNRSTISFLGRAAMGIEFTFRELFYLRGGWGSGYPCAGLGLKRKGAEFSLSWFSVEAGRQYHEEKDTRYVLHYQIRAF